MKIKQVEELVGITSKNIRFYESQGLLNPERADNGYREYRMEDVEILKTIKLLRMIGVSLEEIQKVLTKTTSLEMCLIDHVEHLEREQENIERVQALTNSMVSKATNIEDLQTDYWLEEMEKLEKEGLDFVDVNKVDIHMKKKFGALVAGLVAILFMLAYVSIIIYSMSVDKNFPVLFGILMIAVPAAVIIGVVVALRGRMKEIEGGEEDEASKY